MRSVWLHGCIFHFICGKRGKSSNVSKYAAALRLKIRRYCGQNRATSDFRQENQAAPAVRRAPIACLHEASLRERKHLGMLKILFYFRSAARRGIIRKPKRAKRFNLKVNYPLPPESARAHLRNTPVHFAVRVAHEPSNARPHNNRLGASPQKCGHYAGKVFL
jgi:hypothetical protein